MPIVAAIPEPNTRVELREVSEPELEPKSALLEVELSEVCGTDVYLQQGRLEGVPYPLVPGQSPSEGCRKFAVNCSTSTAPALVKVIA